MLFSVYMTFFNHGPPEDIINRNRQLRDGQSQNGLENEHVQQREESDQENADSKARDEDNPDFVESKLEWDSFIKANKYVSIGDIYDSCGKYMAGW